MKYINKRLGFLQAALLVWASSSNASVAVFPVTSTAAFGDYQPQPSSSNISYSVGKNVFADQAEFAWGGRAIKSKLAFDGLAFDADATPFELGSLRYDNATFLSELAISSVKLDIKLSFSGIGEKIISYDIGIDDTPNSGPGCTVNGCPDIITITPSFNDGKLLLTTAGNTQYIFEFLGFDTAGTQNSRKFETSEGANSTAQLFGRITTSAVPVPGAIWSFLSGSMLLAGVAAQRRREKI